MDCERDVCEAESDPEMDGVQDAMVVEALCEALVALVEVLSDSDRRVTVRLGEAEGDDVTLGALVGEEDGAACLVGDAVFDVIVFVSVIVVDGVFEGVRVGVTVRSAEGVRDVERESEPPDRVFVSVVEIVVEVDLVVRLAEVEVDAVEVRATDSLADLLLLVIVPDGVIEPGDVDGVLLIEFDR